MTAIVEQALAAWGLSGATHSLIAARENAVYGVAVGPKRYALRLHRKGYRTDAELASELAWMAAAAQGGVRVPAPVALPDGAFMQVFGGVQVDMLSWLPGVPLDDALTDAPPARRIALFAALGQQMALLHILSDQWVPPKGFTRVHWDRDGLLGSDPLWGRFWENPRLSDNDCVLFKRFRTVANARLSQIGPSLDYGLIHADLVPGNVLVDGENLCLIDFDDGGFGYRLFEVATALFKHLDAPDYADLKAALITGYHAHRPLDVSALDLFMALRAATYVGWNITRMDEAHGAARNSRFIETLRVLADAYLAKAAPA